MMIVRIIIIIIIIIIIMLRTNNGRIHPSNKYNFIAPRMINNNISNNTKKENGRRTQTITMKRINIK